jgi:hypothetical protein
VKELVKLRRDIKRRDDSHRGEMQKVQERFTLGYWLAPGSLLLLRARISLLDFDFLLLVIVVTREAVISDDASTESDDTNAANLVKELVKLRRDIKPVEPLQGRR